MAAIDAVEYDWGLPEQFNFTRDVVEQLAEDPHRRALTFVDDYRVLQQFTFAQLAMGAARWAHVIRGIKAVPQGARVLVLMGKVPTWATVMLGALKGGLVAVPCPEQLRARDLAFRVRHCDASLIVADRRTQDEIDAMQGLLERPVEVLYVDEAQEALQRQPSRAPTEDTRWYEDAFILYTSGTTHEPKGVTHTHAYAFASRMQAEYWLGARPGDVVWCTAGTGWAKSIWNVLLGPWSRGAEVVLHDGPFDAAERLDLIDRLGVTILCQAPTEYRMLAKLDGLERYPLSRLRHAVSAGEPLNPQVIDRFQDAFQLTVHDGYGQTENTLLVANTLGIDVRPGSMGVPTPGHHVAVIDGDGREVRDGDEGDIALFGRPPSLFDRYWEAPEETAAMFRGDWYVTGDRAARDEDGYFWFSGRADDVILSAAYRIGPFEVESALLEHPTVAESAVVGKPDPVRGQLVKAFVVLRPGLEGNEILVSELQEHAKRVTAPYKYPREIEFVSELPKTRSGKIRRAELRALEVRRAQEQPVQPVLPTPAPPIVATPSPPPLPVGDRTDQPEFLTPAERSAFEVERVQQEQSPRARRSVRSREAKAAKQARASKEAAERRAREEAAAARAAKEARAAREAADRHAREQAAATEVAREARAAKEAADRQAREHAAAAKAAKQARATQEAADRQAREQAAAAKAAKQARATQEAADRQAREQAAAAKAAKQARAAKEAAERRAREQAKAAQAAERAAEHQARDEARVAKAAEQASEQQDHEDARAAKAAQQAARRQAREEAKAAKAAEEAAAWHALEEAREREKQRRLEERKRELAEDRRRAREAAPAGQEQPDGQTEAAPPRRPRRAENAEDAESDPVVLALGKYGMRQGGKGKAGREQVTKEQLATRLAAPTATATKGLATRSRSTGEQQPAPTKQTRAKPAAAKPSAGAAPAPRKRTRNGDERDS